MDAYLVLSENDHRRLYQSASGHPILPSKGDEIVIDGNELVVTKIVWKLDLDGYEYSKVLVYTVTKD